MPSSLTRVLPRTLGFSPHTPVSVYGTGGRSLARSFSRQCRSGAFGSLAVPSASRLALVRDGFACPARRTLAHELPISCAPAFLCHSIALDDSCRFRNFNRMSISYAPCLGLGPDLPWDDDRCPGILMLSVEWILTILFATHTNILTSVKSTVPYRTTSALTERSPTPRHMS